MSRQVKRQGRPGVPGIDVDAVEDLIEAHMLSGMVAQLDVVISDGCSWESCSCPASTLSALAGVTEIDGHDVTFFRGYLGFCSDHVPGSGDWFGLVLAANPDPTAVVGSSVISMPVLAWKELAAGAGVGA